MHDAFDFRSYCGRGELLITWKVNYSQFILTNGYLHLPNLKTKMPVHHTRIWIDEKSHFFR